MNSIILCEGFDDVFVLGYYLFKTDHWKYDKNGKVSNLYNFPKVNFRNQIIEVYKKENDTVAIWCVGGKDSFGEPFKFIQRINEQHPVEGIQQVFILTDRDNDDILRCLKVISNNMRECGFTVEALLNNQINSYNYRIEDESFILKYYSYRYSL